MTTIVLVVLLILIAMGIGGALTYFLGGTPGDTYHNQPRTYGSPRRGVGIGAVVGLVLGALILAYASYTPIDAGKVGLVYGPSGSIIGHMDHGGFVVPWDSVKQVDTRVQSLEFDNLSTYAKQPIPVPVSISLNYSVDPNHVESLIRNVGPDFADKLIASRVQNDLKDATVKYDIRTLPTHREDIRLTVRTHLRQELAPYSITIESIQVKNIQLPQSIQQAEDTRQVANINAQAATNQVKVVQAQARQRVAQATGEKEAAIQKAQGEAEANRLIAASIARNPRIIDYTKAQAMLALANNPNTKVIPSGSIFNFNGATP